MEPSGDSCSWNKLRSIPPAPPDLNTNHWKDLSPRRPGLPEVGCILWASPRARFLEDSLMLLSEWATVSTATISKYRRYVWCCVYCTDPGVSITCLVALRTRAQECEGTCQAHTGMGLGFNSRSNVWGQRLSIFSCRGETSCVTSEGPPLWKRKAPTA